MTHGGESPKEFYAVSYSLLALLSACPAIVLFYDGVHREDRFDLHKRFFSVWAAMMVPLHSRAYVNALEGGVFQGGNHQRRIEYAFAWPESDFCWYTTYFWAASCLIQHLYVPKKIPKKWTEVMGVVMFYWVLGVLLWVIVFSTGKGHGQPRAKGMEIDKNFGWLSDNGAKFMPFLSLLLTEMLEYLDSGHGQSINWLAMVLFIDTLVLNIVWGGLDFSQHWSDDGTNWAILLFALTWLISTCALYSPERVRSNDTNFFKRPLPERPAGRISLRTAWWMADFAQSILSRWQGQNLMFLASGLASLLFYGFGARTLKANLEVPGKPQPGSFGPTEAKQLVDWAIRFSLLLVCLPVYNVIVDSNRCLRWLPVDRYGRLMTVVKVAMTWYKVDILFYSKAPSGGGSWVILVGQFLTIALSVLVGTASSLMTMIDFFNGHRTRAWEFTCRSANVLLLGSTICVVCIWSLTVMLAMSKSQGFAKVLHAVNPGQAVNIADPYLFFFFGLINEVTLVSRRAGEPLRPFHSTNSFECLRCVATLCAIKFPLHALNDWIFVKQLYWPFWHDLLTGDGLGEYVSSWVPPVMFYSSIGLTVGAW
eukprot:CAMPEP_0172685286 /NCGR_PEP_ID=MMETSP1074-20121228/20132_1 /TAXON_ID=2916 /ORGANISM="Ceratium fusus, Strain PA161109" /LENGTH=592 /DNA_ID=CAMNT_0013504401 /DNA_START=113 /DNA_END=1888 /DNA_ORIENTATION=-